jgi:hypothetical protein
MRGRTAATRLMTPKGASKFRDVKADTNPAAVEVRKGIKAVQAAVASR